MPTFDLKGIKIGKYVNTNGTISYDGITVMGDAMSVNLQLTFAEGRLYAEGRLAEYIKEITGGTASIAVKYIKDAAHTLLFGSTTKERTIGEKKVKSTVTSAKDTANYVGVVFYAPDKIDGVQKYTCVLVKKVLFGPPALAYQTKGQNITFQTPTTTGEFLPDDSDAAELTEVAVVDTEAEAIAWGSLVLGETEA